MGPCGQSPCGVPGTGSALKTERIFGLSPACSHRSGFFFVRELSECSPVPMALSEMAYNRRDSYYKKAKQEGYRSRAAYKLLELQQHYHLLRSGDAVVDLGAAPGGWLQVAVNAVGQNGIIVGVDLQAIQPFHERNIALLQGDMTSGGIREKIKTLLHRPADCVLSDLAPKLSGIRDADMARCLELSQIALETAVELLRPGGALLIKGFISNDLHTFTAELKKHFSGVQRTKPEATRQGSSEFYFVARGFIPRVGAPV